jgi:hypothetical protein
MTPQQRSPTRPEFESLGLAIDEAETRQQVERAVRGLATSETDDGVRYRTLGGMLVAIVRPQSGDDDAQSELAYRTAPASDPATRKASKIVDALMPHAVDR